MKCNEGKGSSTASSRALKQESILNIIQERIPAILLESNRQALELGLKLAFSRHEKVLERASARSAS